MPRSTCARGATPATNGGLRPHDAPTNTSNTSANKSNISVLPPAGRAAQMRRWGITPERIGDDRARRDDHRRAQPGEPHIRRVRRADTAPQRAFLKAGGWSIATLVEGGGRGHGLTTHRGVLHPDEYVDQAAMEAHLAERLGFTVAEVRSVYRQGRMSAEGRALRARIDARLLEIAEQGGLMAELGRALGFAVKADGHCRTVENALSRARAARKEQS